MLFGGRREEKLHIWLYAEPFKNLLLCIPSPPRISLSARARSRASSASETKSSSMACNVQEMRDRYCRLVQHRQVFRAQGANGPKGHSRIPPLRTFLELPCSIDTISIGYVPRSISARLSAGLPRVPDGDDRGKIEAGKSRVRHLPLPAVRSHDHNGAREPSASS